MDNKKKQNGINKSRNLSSGHFVNDNMGGHKNLNYVLENINALIHSPFRFDVIINEIILEASQAIKSESSAICLGQKGEWVVSYAQGFAKNIIGMSLNERDEPHALLAIQTKKVVIIKDTFNDNRVNHEQMKKWGIRSVIVVPLITKDEISGVIFFNFYNQINDFNEATIEFVKIFSSSISTAFENVKLYEDIDKSFNNNKIEVENSNQIEILKKQSDILNISSEIIFAWRLTGQIIFWNERASNKYGYDIEEIMGKICHDLLNTNRINLVDIIATLLKDGVWSGELERKSKDGRILNIKTKMHLTLNENGEQIIFETNEDITLSKNMERELLFSKDLLNTVIENFPSPFAIYDKEGMLIKINAAGRKLYPVEDTVKSIEAFHRSFGFLNLEGNKILSKDLPLNRALRGELVNHDVIAIKREEGSQITAIDAAPIRDRDNNLVCYVSFHTDITETFNDHLLIKEQQDRLLQNEIEKNKILKSTIEMQEEFLAVISHELRTPLTVITAAVQTMEIVCEKELPDQAKKYLSKIQLNSDRQLKLINNILDNASMNSGFFKLNIAPRDIVPLTRTIVESVLDFVKRKNIEISFTSAINKAIIRIDEEHYERVLLNLLANAVKFIPENESIDVKIFQLLVQGEYKVCIQVRDTGIGISKDNQKKIFSRFGQVNSSLTRQAEGAGLGLYISNALVKMMGGEIRLESEQGIGSTFSVILPLIKLEELITEQVVEEKPNDRLIKAVALEFSDIY